MLGGAETNRLDLGTLTMCDEEYDSRRRRLYQAQRHHPLPDRLCIADPGRSRRSRLGGAAGLRGTPQPVPWAAGHATRPIVLGRQSLGRAR